MHIDSVRELKAELVKKHLQPLAASPAKISALEGVPVVVEVVGRILKQDAS